MRGGNGDGEETQCRRAQLIARAQVVAAVQEQRRGADVLRRLDEREQRGREQRLLEPVGTEELVGERREEDDEERREEPAHDLEEEGLAEETSQPAPVFARDVPEPVLRQRLLDGEVEQYLEEAHDGERRGEHAEVVEPEDPGGDDRPEDAAGDGSVDPHSSRRPPPERARGHRVSVRRTAGAPASMRPRSSRLQGFCDRRLRVQRIFGRAGNRARPSL